MKKKTGQSLSGKDLVNVIVAAMQDKMAEAITVLDLREAEAVADYFIICQSDTDVQNRAIADAVVDQCAENNTYPWHQEGETAGRWVLIDFTDVVVHVMLADLRSFYALETLWSAGKRSDI